MREGVDAQNVEPGTIFDGFPEMDPTEMAAIGETEAAIVQFKGDIDVHAHFALVGTFEQFIAI